MGLFSRFENKMEDTVEGAANAMANAPISPVQIEKKAEKQMKRETMVGAGKEYAPTLYTVLVNPDDDARLFGYYPTLAGEIETYLQAKAVQQGLIMDGQPLVRFVVDDGLRHGKFDVIAEAVAAPIVTQLRQEEMQRYGLIQASAQQQPYAPAPQQGYAPQQPYAPAPQQGYAPQQPYAPAPQQGYAPAPQPYDQGYGDNWGQPYDQGYDQTYDQGYDQGYQEPEPPVKKPPLPYVPEDEIDYSIDYGEYTFNSEDFEDYRDKAQQDARYGAHRRAPEAVPPRGAAGARQGGPNTVDFAGKPGQPIPNRAQVNARLVNLAYQRKYDLGADTATIGRESSNDIVVQDINASRKHAELKRTPQGVWTITDLGSTNGTVVNGVAVATQPLRTGDRITIGKTEFEFIQQ